ncbi:hypothetical protein [Pseudovibrio denitrificans]|uniref:hypothetical protein n=1 Tax=Pseudovibrio denitrificans TaxID=258256 RepID=UPI001AD8D895|nr:hypothetical protein [Pseudovibrio denitrificans]
MSETKRKSWKALIGTGALALTLAGCSSLSSLNPFGGDDEFLEGDRQLYIRALSNRLRPVAMPRSERQPAAPHGQQLLARRAMTLATLQSM